MQLPILEPMVKVFIEYLFRKIDLITVKVILSRDKVNGIRV